VRDEIRANVARLLEGGESLFPGILGYEDTVVPQLVNALLAGHHFVLLGLRGQAKSRLLRLMVRFLEPEIPMVAGCEIHDDPFRPLCANCRELIGDQGDATPIELLPRERRYLEKLATPDVTIADLVGDLDPIKAAKHGLALADGRAVHYGLLPRAHRGILAINELPDLAPKIQVGLFNAMQEGDIQFKGHPIRLPVDLILAFTANPEDYTARGKIITPLKDRIQAEIRTHYPRNLEIALAITAQEVGLECESRGRCEAPRLVREVVEEIAFTARGSTRVDKRSGVSQRLPISALETAIANAERRCLLNHESEAVVRIGDLYAALPAITGKFELEYEGELRGAENLARDLIRAAVKAVYMRHFAEADNQRIVQWFELGGTLLLGDSAPVRDALERFGKIGELFEAAGRLGLGSGAAARVAASEFVLEGLYALGKISRSEEHGYGPAAGRRTRSFFEPEDDEGSEVVV
jgi:magnesium chelatase subunit I